MRRAQLVLTGLQDRAGSTGWMEQEGMEKAEKFVERRLILRGYLEEYARQSGSLSIPDDQPLRWIWRHHAAGVEEFVSLVVEWAGAMQTIRKLH